MICKKCGNVNPRNSRYCRHCGARLETPEAVAPLPEEEFEVAADPDTSPVDHGEEVNRLLERAFGLSERDDLAGAAFLCTQAIDLDPDSVSAHSLLGLLYERMGRTQEAILEYERVVDLNPTSAVDREHLQRLRGGEVRPRPTTRRPTRPLNWFGQTPYLSSIPVIAAATLGMVLILVANRAAESGVGFGPKRSLYNVKDPVGRLLDAGVTQFKRGQYEDAAQSFQAVLMIDPTNEKAKSWLARTEMETRRRIARAPRKPPQLVGPPPDPKRSVPSEAADEGVPSPAPRVPAPALVKVPKPLPPSSMQQTTTQTSTKTAGSVRRETAAANTAAAETRTPPPVRRAVRESAPAHSEPPPTRSNPKPRIRIEGHPAPSGAASGASRPSNSTAQGGSADAQELEREATRSYMEGDVEGAAEQYRRSLAAGEAEDADVAFRHQQLGEINLSRGNHSVARAEYRLALAAYRRQLSKGVREEEARMGIRTCESALKLCRP